MSARSAQRHRNHPCDAHSLYHERTLVVDSINPPKHPDRSSSCPALLWMFMCVVFSGGCLLVGGIVASVSSFSLVSGVRQTILQKTLVVDVMPPSLPTIATHDSFDRIALAQDAISRTELWRRVPEWFDSHSGAFNAVAFAIDVSTVVMHQRNNSNT